MVVVYLHPHGRLTTRQFTSHRERGLHTFLQVAVAPKYPDFFPGKSQGAIVDRFLCVDNSSKALDWTYECLCWTTIDI